MKKIFLGIFLTSLVALGANTQKTGIEGPQGPQGPPGPAGSPGVSFPSQSGNTGKFLQTNGSSVLWAPVNSAVWGNITGTLSDQTDLASALSSKEPTISAGISSQYYRGDKSFQTLNSSVVPEGSNLYFTNARVDTEFDTRLATKSTSNLTEGSNLYYTSGRFDSAFSGKSTTNLSEGTNLYYTQGRFDSAFGAKSTTGLAEGTNLYYTNTRARNSLSASSPLSYDNSTGNFTVDLSAYAPLASPNFTGVPTAPTASVGTSTTQLATTAFVLSQGFSGASGSIPFAHQSSTSVVTNATSTYSTAISTTITVTASSAPVYAKATGVFTVTGAIPTVLKYRVSINGVAGQEQLLSLTALTTNYTAAAQYLSAALTPGTYTILFEIARNSGTGTVSFFEGTLDAIALQGASSNGITSLSGLGLSAGPGSGAQSLTGTLSLAGMGLTATNGAVIYSTASALGKTAAGSANQILQSAGAAAPLWSTATYPATTTINQILYSSAANAVTGLATANTGALVTSATGVPSLTSGATANRVLRTNGTTVSFAQVNLGTDVVTVPSQRIPFGNGTGLVTDANFIYDTTNTILSVGGSGTAKINAINASGSHTALQAYNSSAGNAFQATNVSAYTAALISRQNNNNTGASIGLEFGRGTAASPTQALSGDQLGVIVATPDASDGAAHGYSGSISFVASENATTTATGGDLALATTPNGAILPIERMRITNDGLVKSKMGFTNDTSGAQPTCDSSHRGTTWLIQGGAGVADIFQVCMKDAADVYNWVTK